MQSKLKQTKKASKQGITLITLVVAIIILLILAGIGIYISLVLVDQSKYTAFITEIIQIEENVKLLKLDKEVASVKTGEKVIFEPSLTQTEMESFPQTLLNEIKYIRKKYSGENVTEKIPSDYSEETIEIGEGKNIYYVDKEQAQGREYAYIYDEQTERVYKIKPTVIWGVTMHGYEYANLLKTQKGLIEKVKEANKKEEDDDNNDGPEIDETIIPIAKGEYKLTNGVYLCEPDLTRIYCKKYIYSRLG